MLKGDFIRGTASLSGAIIGVGIFGVPFVFAQVGLTIGLAFFITITAIVLLQHIMYAEVIERTQGKHRLTGYANIYFGKLAKNFMGISVLVGISGALVAYIAFANGFLTILFGSLFGIEYLWGVVFWVVMSIGILMGRRAITRGEVFLLGLLLLVFSIIIVRGLPLISLDNFSYTNFNNFFLPYGVIIFALVGFQAVPEVRDMIRGDGVRFRNAIILGVLIAAAVTLIFGVVVLGVTGTSTSPEAIGGLAPHVGNFIVYIGTIFGLLAVSTSFLIFALNLKETFSYDWGVPSRVSRLITILIPISLFAIGLRNFIETIGIIGVIFGAVDGTMIALLFLAAKKKGKRKPGFSLNIGRGVVAVVASSLILAGIYVIIDIVIESIK